MFSRKSRRIPTSASVVLKCILCPCNHPEESLGNTTLFLDDFRNVFDLNEREFVAVRDGLIETEGGHWALEDVENRIRRILGRSDFNVQTFQKEEAFRSWKSNESDAAREMKSQLSEGLRSPYSGKMKLTISGFSFLKVLHSGKLRVYMWVDDEKANAKKTCVADISKCDDPMECWKDTSTFSFHTTSPTSVINVCVCDKAKRKRVVAEGVISISQLAKEYLFWGRFDSDVTIPSHHDKNDCTIHFGCSYDFQNYGLTLGSPKTSFGDLQAMSLLDEVFERIADFSLKHSPLDTKTCLHPRFLWLLHEWCDRFGVPRSHVDMLYVRHVLLLDIFSICTLVDPVVAALDSIRNLFFKMSITISEHQICVMIWGDLLERMREFLSSFKSPSRMSAPSITSSLPKAINIVAVLFSRNDVESLKRFVHDCIDVAQCKLYEFLKADMEMRLFQGRRYVVNSIRLLGHMATQILDIVSEDKQVYNINFPANMEYMKAAVSSLTRKFVDDLKNELLLNGNGLMTAENAVFAEDRSILILGQNIRKFIQFLRKENVIEHAPLSDVERMESILKPYYKYWFMNVKLRVLRVTERLYANEKWSCMEGDYISSSARDIIRVCDEVLQSIVDFGERDSFFDAISIACEACLDYAKMVEWDSRDNNFAGACDDDNCIFVGLGNMVPDTGSKTAGEGELYIPKTLFIRLCDIVFVEKSLHDIFSRYMPLVPTESERQSLLQLESECHSSFSRFASFVACRVCQVLEAPISECHRMVVYNVEGKDELPDIEDRLVPFYVFLSGKIEQFFEELSEDAFAYVACRIFITCFGAAEGIITGGYFDASTSVSSGTLSEKQLILLERALERIVAFFDLEAKFIPEEVVDSCKSRIHEIISWARMSSKDLVHEYETMSNDSPGKCKIIYDILHTRSDGVSLEFNRRRKKSSTLEMLHFYGLPHSEKIIGAHTCTDETGRSISLCISENYLSIRPMNMMPQLGDEVTLISLSRMPVFPPSVYDERRGRSRLEISVQEPSIKLICCGPHDVLQCIKDELAKASSCGMDRKTRFHMPKEEQLHLLKKFGVPSCEIIVDCFACTTFLGIPGVLYVCTGCICYNGPWSTNYVFGLPQISEINLDSSSSLTLALVGRRTYHFKVTDSSAVLKSICQQVRKAGLLWICDEHGARARDPKEARSQSQEFSEKFERMWLSCDTAQCDVKGRFGISNSELWHGSYKAEYDGDIGYIFLFSNHLCFDSILFSRGDECVILFLRHVVDVLQEGDNICVSDSQRRVYRFQRVERPKVVSHKIRTLASSLGADVSSNDRTNMKRSTEDKIRGEWNIPTDHNLILACRCFNSYLIYGCLYVFSQEIVFFSKFSKSTQRIKLNDIISAKSSRLFPVGTGNSIILCCTDDTEVKFHGLGDKRDATLGTICTAARELSMNIENPDERQREWRRGQFAHSLRDTFGLSRSEDMHFSFLCLSGVTFGRLYVFSNHICFASVFSSKSIHIPVYGIEKVFASSYFGFRTAVVIREKRGVDHKFHGFVGNRNEVLQVLDQRVADYHRAVEQQYQKPQ